MPCHVRMCLRAGMPLCALARACAATAAVFHTCFHVCVCVPTCARARMREITCVVSVFWRARVCRCESLTHASSFACARVRAVACQCSCTRACQPGFVCGQTRHAMCVCA
ncbi:hypothetical protein COO60DRAFT_505306 [Scenedesmus sp. NREL 46B-D3]|nr:hypothetical protein COO60DRAFT_505306 [Scenedesmus sp. NREL 46B-D3]